MQPLEHAADKTNLGANTLTGSWLDETEIGGQEQFTFEL